MVDSGASTTSFPLALLGALGIDRADLAQADDGQGVGSSFNVWSWPGQLTRQVVAYAQQPDGTVDVQRDASRQIPACAQRRVGVGCYVGAKPLAVLDPGAAPRPRQVVRRPVGGVWSDLADGHQGRRMPASSRR